MRTRRDFLEKIIGNTAGAVTARALSAVTLMESCVGTPQPLQGIFPHGVASGDPNDTSVILWTRLNTEAAGTVEVNYELSTSTTFDTIAKNGTINTNADRDHTVKARVEGLIAATTYYYRFRFSGTNSVIGRTKTTGANGRLRLGVVTCANYERGFFHAYRDLAARADLDAIIHLGDYYYEYENFGYGNIAIRLTEPPFETVQLTDYRARFGNYRLDADLQELHRQHPMISVWDDHETANDSYQDGAQNHQPIEGAWSVRKAAAIRAYDEWMPVDIGPGGKVFRALPFGNLVDLIMLDTRLWGRERQLASIQDAATANPDRQLLGADQEQFLLERLRTSSARWKIIGSQVAMMQLDRIHDDADKWDGYPAQRERVLRAIEAGVQNVVVLSGDMHWSLAGDLAIDPYSPSYNPNSGQGAQAVEFMAPPVSSPNIGPADLVQRAATTRHLKYAENSSHGYLLLDVNDSSLQGQYFYAQDVRVRSGHVFRAGAAFAVEAGRASLRSISQLRDAPEAAPLAPQ